MLQALHEIIDSVMHDDAENFSGEACDDDDGARLAYSVTSDIHEVDIEFTTLTLDSPDPNDGESIGNPVEGFSFNVHGTKHYHEIEMVAGCWPKVQIQHARARSISTYAIYIRRAGDRINRNIYSIDRWTKIAAGVLEKANNCRREIPLPVKPAFPSIGAGIPWLSRSIASRRTRRFARFNPEYLLFAEPGHLRQPAAYCRFKTDLPHGLSFQRDGKGAFAPDISAEGKITDANGPLYAHGTITCMMFPV